MRISGEIPKVYGAYSKQNTVKKVDKTVNTTTSNDVVSISNAAMDFSKVLKAVKEVPDMREDRVNELREKYESGKYNMDGKDIAGKIAKSVIDKKV